MGQGPRTAADYANPLAASLYNIAGRRATYPGGTYQTSLGESVRRNLERLAPNVTLGRQLVSPSGEGRYPEDATRLGRLKRELGVFPIEIEREPKAGQRAREAVREERAAVLPALHGKVDAEDKRWIARAYTIAEQMAVLRARANEENDSGEPYYRAVLAAEARLWGKIGIFDKEDVAWLTDLAENGSFEEVKSRRSKLIASVYEQQYLKAVRYAREEAGIER